jgi:hypothetical protein
MCLGKLSENPAVQMIEKAQRIAVALQTEFSSERGDGIVGFDTLQIGPCTLEVMFMIDGQERRPWCQYEIECIIT